MGLVTDKLIEARDLIARPWAWTKGDYESTKNGVDCYCAVGAVRAVTPFSERNNVIEVLNKDRVLGRGKHVSGDGAVIDYNDKKTTTKKDILALFNRAIKRAQKAGL